MVQKTGTKTSKKSRKKKKKKFKILKYTIISLFCALLLGIVAATGIVLAIVKTAPPLDENQILALSEPSSIYDNKNQLMDYASTDENRTIITYNQMTDNLKNAFVSIEDERFWQHHGVDPKRIASVIYLDIKNKITKQNYIQGASTITQQLVKNRLFLSDSLSNRISYKRKIQEMYLAYELENKLTKEQILEAYLNTIYLGGKAHGVEAAANQYFNKSTKDLTLVECAFLAGINQSPMHYYPFSGPAKKDNSIYLNRTKLVLEKMYENKYISKDQYDKALSDINLKKISFKQNTTNTNRLQFEWFSLPAMQQVKNDLKSQYHYTDKEVSDLFMYGGLKIYTTMDRSLQNAAQSILDDDKNLGIHSTTVPTKVGNTVINVLQPQASAVITDYRTGEVKAIIGGRGTQPPASYNRAADNGLNSFYRPTGSSIKPLTVYSPAIDTKQATAATVIEDSPLPEEIGKLYPTANGPYNPSNYDTEGFSGYVNIREAIKRSINLVAIKLENQIGLKTGATYGEKFGLTLDADDKSSLAALSIGQLHHGANTLQMAEAFGVFGNSGLYTQARLYTKVTDRTGRILLESKAVNSKVLSSQAAYIMYDLLKGPTTSGGTAPNARFGDMPVAGKTGTSGDKKDFWFCGLTPHYSGAVWIGNDTPKTYGSGSGLSSSTSAGLWAKIMEVANKGLDTKDISEPDGITQSVVCSVSGKLPLPICSSDPRGNETYSEMFINGTVPSQYCDIHVEAKVNSSNGKLATDNTPANLIQSKVFIKRDYVPSVGLGDEQYVLPKEYDK